MDSITSDAERAFTDCRAIAAKELELILETEWENRLIATMSASSVQFLLNLKVEH